MRRPVFPTHRRTYPIKTNGNFLTSLCQKINQLNGQPARQHNHLKGIHWIHEQAELPASYVLFCPISRLQACIAPSLMWPVMVFKVAEPSGFPAVGEGRPFSLFSLRSPGSRRFGAALVVGPAQWEENALISHGQGGVWAPWSSSGLCLLRVRPPSGSFQQAFPPERKLRWDSEQISLNLWERDMDLHFLLLSATWAWAS